MSVEKIQNHYLAGKPRDINSPSVLVRQDGARHPFPNSQRFWLRRTCLKLLYHRQATGCQGLLLKIAEFANCDAFCVAHMSPHPESQNRPIVPVQAWRGKNLPLPRIWPCRHACHPEYARMTKESFCAVHQLSTPFLRHTRRSPNRRGGCEQKRNEDDESHRSLQ